MSTGLRIFLIVGSVLSGIYVLRKIRKSKMKTEDSLFWLTFSAVLILLGIFPSIAKWFADILGIQSPANLVYLMIIFLLVIKVFLQDQKLAKTESKLTQMVQRYAIARKEDREHIS